MKKVAVIPARYGSTRFPGKPMAKICGKPMIIHVYERVKKSINIDEVVVATDNEKILNLVKEYGGKAIMTSSHHESGSDRVAEVAKRIEGDIFVNVQGDEPLISTKLIEDLVELSINNPTKVITAKTKIINESDIKNPNIVKIVTDRHQNALYFTRSIIPYNRLKDNGVDYYKHIGVYSYPKEILREFVNLPHSKLERIEMLEQLRLLENGYSIKVLETEYDSVGVDTPEDITKIERLLEDKT